MQTQSLRAVLALSLLAGGLFTGCGPQQQAAAPLDQQLAQSQQQVQDQISQLSQNIQQIHAQMKMHLLHRHGLRRLPNQQSGQAKSVDGHVNLAAGDKAVPASTMQDAEQILQTVSLPTLQKELGVLPNQQTRIVLFSSPQSYARALAQAGVAKGDLQSIAQNTGGLTIGSDIWVPLYQQDDRASLADTFTHELTHVVFNQNGIGDQLPTWVNEGMAWHDGMTARAAVNPALAQQVANQLNREIVKVKRTGELLPLTASEDDILNAQYNVEWEDYLAVKNLVQTKGSQKFMGFLNGIKKQGVANSFQQQYGESIQTFEQAFLQSLN